MASVIVSPTIPLPDGRGSDPSGEAMAEAPFLMLDASYYPSTEK
jgi:hypothetical protein